MIVRKPLHYIAMHCMCVWKIMPCHWTLDTQMASAYNFVKVVNGADAQPSAYVDAPYSFVVFTCH